MRHLTMRMLLLSLLILTTWAGESFSATFTSTPAGGTYWSSKKQYVLAVWVEGPSSTTRAATIYGTTGEGTNLSQWKAKGGNQNNGNLTVDGVMGATLNSSLATAPKLPQQTRTVTWDLTKPYKTGSTTLIADGSYQIWLESVDANTPAPGTASITGANRFHFTFVRDGVSRSNVPITDPAGKFTGITYTCIGRVPTNANTALSISTGSSTTFEVTNNAAVAPTAYQWRKGGTPIGGATGSTYPITSAVVGDAGSYDCVLSYPNTYGLGGTSVTMTSNALTLNVSSGLVPVLGSTITPASSTVNPGAVVTLTNNVDPPDATSPVYAWYSNTISSTTTGTITLLSGTASTYTTPPAASGTMYYFGTITAGGNNRTSSPVQVIVRAAPTTSDPASIIVAAGGTANFSVSANANGFAPLTYKWQSMPSSGGTWTDISGATSTAYSTTTLVNGTQYQCIVTNAGGAGVAVTSNTATLTVVSAPTITANTTPMNPSALSGSTVNFSVAGTIPGTPAGALTYQWQYRSSSAGTFANVGGATAATYAATATTSGEQYRCILTNTIISVAVSSTSTTSTITVATAAPPLFTTQPASVSVFAGATASFTVAVSGVPTPTLEWSDSADNVTFTPIGGATASTYSTPATSAADVGVPRYYRCTATNGSGSVNSAVATRTVTGAPTGIGYINFTSSSAGGLYAPKNVLVAWIQRGTTFITTLGDWSGERKTSLVLWASVNGGSDAVMGATRLSHTPIANLVWNFNPATTPDGTYTLWLEAADANPGPIGAATTTSVSGANRGRLDFTIVSGSVVQANSSSGGFSGIQISAFYDAAAAATAAAAGGGGETTAQDAGKVASCGSGGVFALICGLGLALTLRRRRT